MRSRKSWGLSRIAALAFAVGAACAAVVGGCTSFEYLTRAGEDGVTCVSCHLEEGKLSGPNDPTGLVAPHPVRVTGARYRESRFCGRCHEGTQATGGLSELFVSFEHAAPQKRHAFDPAPTGVPAGVYLGLHLFLTIANPPTRESLDGMLSGHVSAEYAAVHHPLWVGQAESTAVRHSLVSRGVLVGAVVALGRPWRPEWGCMDPQGSCNAPRTCGTAAAWKCFSPATGLPPNGCDTWTCHSKNSRGPGRWAAQCSTRAPIVG